MRCTQRPVPRRQRRAGVSTGWESGVARPATAERFRSWPCFTSHLPPEIPRPAPRGVLRAAVGRSSDSWTRKAFAFLLAPPLPKVRASVPMASSFPHTAAGQCRNWLVLSRTGFPFHPAVVAAETDGHNIVGCLVSVNTKCSVEPKCFLVRRFHGRTRIRTANVGATSDQCRTGVRGELFPATPIASAGSDSSRSDVIPDMRYRAGATRSRSSEHDQERAAARLNGEPWASIVFRFYRGLTGRARGGTPLLHVRGHHEHLPRSANPK
jgi:hypothetical protein